MQKHKIDLTLFLAICFSSLALLTIGCSRQSGSPSQDPNGPIHGTQSQNILSVMDKDGYPISNALIYVGSQEFYTDDSGKIQASNSWSQPEPITIIKDGFITTTYLNQRPGSIRFQIQKQKSTSRYELNGSVTGFGGLPKDGYIDFSITVPALSTQELLDYDLSQMVSPEFDSISALGQRIDIPSNVFIPRQKESYSFLPITLEKSFYRTFFDSLGLHSLHTNHGKFSLKKVVEKLQSGAPLFDAINDFEFLTLGIKDVLISGNEQSLNLDSNQLQLNQSHPLKINPKSGSLLFGLALIKDKEKFVTTDIHLLDKNSQNFKFPTNSSDNFVLLAETEPDKNSSNPNQLSPSMSTALIPMNQSTSVKTLKRIAKPIVKSSNQIELEKPELPVGIQEYATYVSLSNVEKTNGLEKKTVLWEFYASRWIDSLDIPSSIAPTMAQGNRWDVVFFGTDHNTDGFLGPNSLQSATHAVRNSVDF